MDPMLAGAAALALVLLVVVFMVFKKPAKFLDKSRQKLRLGKIVELSHDTKLFRFELPSASMAFGLPLGKHVKIFCPNMTGVVAGQWNGREDPEADAAEIQRAYTPTSSEDDLGVADLVIKVYAGGVVDRFPDGGKMSQYFGSLKVGDEVALQGPVGTIEYLGRGKWMYGRREIAGVSAVGMMAGGTGITPMYQVACAALKDAGDSTKFSLIFANQTEPDILLKQELDALAAKYPARFSVHYTLDRPPAKWAGSAGFITEAMIKDNLPPPAPGTLVVMCGPPPMIKFACKANLDKLGYDKKKALAF